MNPLRIQRKRTKGWKMPQNTVYVGRGSQWGNPFTTKQANGNAMAVHAFRRMLAGDLDFVRGHEHQAHMILDGLHKLRGKNLACWCALTSPCHGDVLLEIANRD